MSKYKNTALHTLFAIIYLMNLKVATKMWYLVYKNTSQSSYKKT